MQNNTDKIFVAGLQKQSFVDYPGAVSCVIFLAGCNMRCHYCHNSQLFDPGENKIPLSEVLAHIEKNKKMLDAVVISGGEPTLDPNLPAIIALLRPLGLKIKLDTNGTTPELIKNLDVDYIALDVKAPMNRYKEIAGFDNAECVKETAEYLKNQNKADYMFRTTLSPLLTEADIDEMGKSIVNNAKIWQLQQFVPNEYSGKTPAYTPETVQKFAHIAKNYSQRVVVRGL